MDTQERRPPVENGWVLCPHCGRGKVLHLRPGTRAVQLEVYCRRCRQSSVIRLDEEVHMQAYGV